MAYNGVIASIPAAIRPADEVFDRSDAHGLQCVDLFVDPHRAQLGGDAGAEGRRQADPRDDGRRNSDVDECRQEPGQRFDADVAQRAVALDRQDAARGERENPTMTTVPPIIANVPAPMLISAMSRITSRR